MDLLVSKIVGILETEPIDVYVNPTFLPPSIAARYDTLWTEARMAKVIDAAVKNGVAIEINGRYKMPSERFLRLAKSKGAKFTFGTNNAGAADLGDWSYPLAMQKAARPRRGRTCSCPATARAGRSERSSAVRAGCSRPAAAGAGLLGGGAPRGAGRRGAGRARAATPAAPHRQPARRACRRTSRC